MKREVVSAALNSLDDRHIADTANYSPEIVQSSPERTVYMNRKRIIPFALATVLLLAFGITAYAVWGVPRSIGTHLMPRTAEYTSLSELPKIEKDVGFPVIAPEQFSNGYTFTALRVDGQAVFGENDEVLKEYYAVHVFYSKNGAPDLMLELSPLLEYEGKSAAPAPGEQRMVDDVMVDLSLDHYKMVPEDYEKTEDDLAREAAGHYYVSFGSDKIEEHEIAFANFKLGDVVYLLMDMSANGDSFDTLILMAEEIIESAES